MKKLRVSLLLLTLISSIGCGKDEVKPSTDSLMTQEVLSIMDVIKTAYEEKDREILKENISQGLMEDISKELYFREAELSLTPRLVRITASNIIVHTSWRGVWNVKDKILRDRGVAILVFEREGKRLTQIDGDNPFHIPMEAR